MLLEHFLPPEHWSGEMTVARHSGSTFPAYVISTPFDDGVVLTITDISNWRRFDAKLAHDFNNVLMGIVPFVEIIRRSPANPEKVATALKHITDALERGKRLVAGSSFDPGDQE